MPVLPDYFLYHIVNYIIYSLPIWGIKGVWLFNIIKAVKLLMFKFPVELVNLFLLLCINTILILGLIITVSAFFFLTVHSANSPSGHHPVRSQRNRWTVYSAI